MPSDSEDALTVGQVKCKHEWTNNDFNILIIEYMLSTYLYPPGFMKLLRWDCYMIELLFRYLSNVPSMPCNVIKS